MSSSTANGGIARSAARLRVGVFAAITVMVLVYVAARFGLQLGRAHVEYRVHGLDTTATQLVGDVSTAMLAFALFRLTQMLGRIASGELFSIAVTRYFRGFAFWLLLGALLRIVAPIVIPLAGPIMGGPHEVRIAIDFQEVLTLGVALLLFLLASLLERARRLEDEMREFV